MKPPASFSSWSNRTRWQLIAASVGLALVLAFALGASIPPRTVRMATDAEGGARSEAAERYREIFARHGVWLELVTTGGSVENVARLRDPRSGVSVALVQGGVTGAAEAPELVSLGTLFYEPFWVFSRGAVRDPSGKPRLREGLRTSFGVPGSGTYKHGRELTAAVGFDLSKATVRDLGPDQAAEALMKGELDLIGMMLPWGAPILQTLFLDESLQPMDFLRADAHVALRPYLSKLVLPRGVADLPHDRPSKDLQLIAAKTSLVVRKDLHPAIQYLLIDAASEVHGAPGVFNKAGEFPAAEPVDLPLSEFAREYYRSGKPFLQRHLPFWPAALATPLLVVLIPLAGILYPLFGLGPEVYRWIIRRRIFRLYRELKILEAELELGVSDAIARSFSERLDRLEERADHLYVPTAFTDVLYTLKDHISLVRQRLRERQRDGRVP